MSSIANNPSSSTHLLNGGFYYSGVKSLPSFETTTIRDLGEISTSDYELNIYKLNCIEAFYPYLVVGCKKQLIIYQIQIGNVISNKDENLTSYKHLMTYKLESEINYMTKSDHDKIFIVGEKGLTRMLTKISIRDDEQFDDSMIVDTSSRNLSNSDSLLEKLGLKLIKLYQNRNESTWSISYFGGIWVLGDNSHVIKAQMPLHEMEVPFELEGHTHNLPHLNLYSKERLLSCSIDQSCKIWNMRDRSVLYSHEFDEWCWMGEHIHANQFLTIKAQHSTDDNNYLNSNEHIQKISDECSDLFIIGTQHYIYLLNDTLEKVLFKMFYQPSRGLACVPQYIYESLDRVSFCRVVPKHNLVLIAKQNDNKVILFRLVHSIYDRESNNTKSVQQQQSEEVMNSGDTPSLSLPLTAPLTEHTYSLVPIDCLPSVQSRNQCIIGVTHDESLDRVFIQCLDGQIFSYDLNLILSPLTSTFCLDNVVI